MFSIRSVNSAIFFPLAVFDDSAHDEVFTFRKWEARRPGRQNNSRTPQWTIILRDSREWGKRCGESFLKPLELGWAR